MVRNTYEVQNVGDLLREKRKKLGLDLKQVAEETKIRAEYILALEAGDFSKFPASVYAKGFLRKYSKYLGINPERAAAMYRREKSTHDKDVLHSTDFLRGKLQQTNFRLSPARLLTLAVVILLIGFGVYLASQASAILENPEIALTDPVEAQPGNEVIFSTTEEEVTIAGNIEAGSTLTLNGSAVTVNNLQQFEVGDLQVDLGENRFRLTARNQFGRESEINLLVIREEPPVTPNNTDGSANGGSSGSNNGGTTAPTAPATQGLNAVVSVSGREAYVQVAVDGQPTFAQTMPVGGRQEFVAQNQFAISSPRFDAVGITINNQDFILQSGREHVFSLDSSGVVVVEVR